MRVICTKPGYDNFQLRQPGDEFEFNIDPKVFELPEGKRPSWFEPVGGLPTAKPAKVGKAEKAPKTLAGAAQDQGETTADDLA